MNYYERHLGDYAKDTAHLTMLEHGAYGLLLDRCYATETGIPADQAHRVARARTREERAAVDAVLAEFFVLADGVWTHGRVSREIAKALRKIESARSNGRTGGRPKTNRTRTHEKPTGLLMGSENETEPKAHQTPDTRYQKKSERFYAEDIARAPDMRPPDPDPCQEAEPPGRIDPSPAAVACRAMRQAGLAATNPGDPRLLALLAQGCTEAELVGIAAEAATKGKGWAWVLAVVERRRADAAAIVLNPTAVVPWHATRSGIEGKGAELGLGRWDEAAFAVGCGDPWPVYQARVFRAAGHSSLRAA